MLKKILQGKNILIEYFELPGKILLVNILSFQFIRYFVYSLAKEDSIFFRCSGG